MNLFLDIRSDRFARQDIVILLLLDKNNQPPWIPTLVNNNLLIWCEREADISWNVKNKHPQVLWLCFQKTACKSKNIGTFFLIEHNFKYENSKKTTTHEWRWFCLNMKGTIVCCKIKKKARIIPSPFEMNPFDKWMWVNAQQSPFYKLYNNFTLTGVFSRAYEYAQGAKLRDNDRQP